MEYEWVYIRPSMKKEGGYAVRTDGGLDTLCMVCLDRLHLHLFTGAQHTRT